MKAILIKPFNEAELINYSGNFEYIQKLVGGYVEPVYQEDGTVFLVNEEGAFKGLEQNAYGLLGNIVILRDDCEDFIGVNDKDIEKYIGA